MGIRGVIEKFIEEGIVLKQNENRNLTNKVSGNAKYLYITLTLLKVT